MVLMLSCTIYQIGKDWATYDLLTQVIVFLLAGCYFVASALHGESTYVVGSWLQYMLFLPTFVNILQIYSWCNTQDLSWGTKGIDTAHAAPLASIKGSERVDRELAEQRQNEQMEAQRVARNRFRCQMLLAWIMSNAFMASLIIFLYENQLRSATEQAEVLSLYVILVFYVAGFVNAVRLTGSLAFLFEHWVRRWQNKKRGGLSEPLLAAQY